MFAGLFDKLSHVLWLIHKRNCAENSREQSLLQYSSCLHDNYFHFLHLHVHHFIQKVNKIINKMSILQKILDNFLYTLHSTESLVHTGYATSSPREAYRLSILIRYFAVGTLASRRWRVLAWEKSSFTGSSRSFSRRMAGSTLESSTKDI